MREGNTLDLRIEELGDAGDGIAMVDGRRIFVPLTLPGERWLVRLGEMRHDHARASPLERREGPDRATPPCPHFGRCGGCALQHLPEAAYRAFKMARIERALGRVGLVGTRVTAPYRSPLGSRRRLRLATALSGRTRLVGFRAARSRAVIEITTCPIARPELTALFQPLRSMLRGLACLGKEGELTLSVSSAGVDLLLDLAHQPGLADLERLTEFGHDRDLARVTARIAGAPVPIATRRDPRLRLGPFDVPLPPGTFLQATEEGEQALQASVAEWLAGSIRIVDLYAGLGTLSLPLAARATAIVLVERAREAVAAIKAARRRASAAKVEAYERDLERQPLLAPELEPYDAVILDPPRAGALAQVRELARARSLPRIVYLSCHPGSFARDAAVLCRAGWRLIEVRPVDQFVFSAEVELAALFGRD